MEVVGEGGGSGVWTKFEKVGRQNRGIFIKQEGQEPAVNYVWISSVRVKKFRCTKHCVLGNFFLG